MASAVILVSDDELALVLDVPVLEVSGEGDWVASAAMRVAEVVEQEVVSPPFVVVVTGAACTQVPTFAVAQRAARRQIAAYVLIEPQLPPPGVSDWPDAPVTVVTRQEAIAHASTLRGWSVSSDEPMNVVAAVVEEN